MDLASPWCDDGDQATILSGKLNKMSAKCGFTPKYSELDEQVMEWFS